MTDPADLGLADIAPITLREELFGGMLDYAVSAEAHDVDDSMVPADAAIDDANDFGDPDAIDDVALPDDAADPFADPPAVPGGDGGDTDNLGVDEIGVTDDIADDGIDDVDAGPGGGFGGDAAGFGPDGYATDGFGGDPVDDVGLGTSPGEDPGLGVDMDW